MYHEEDQKEFETADAAASVEETVPEKELGAESTVDKKAEKAAKKAAKRAEREAEEARREAERVAKRERITKTIKSVWVAFVLVAALLFSGYAVFGDLLFPEDEIYTATKGEALALADARAYLAEAPLSERALIDRLKSDGYATSEIEYALGECNVNFTAQAERAALEYLSTAVFSTDALLEQLRIDGFTSEEAASAVNGITNPEAVATLREILRDGWTSRRMVIDLLSGMGYNEINILYALSVCPVDFNLQAERAAISYLTAEPMLSRAALIVQLEIEGFTAEEATHGADYALNSLS